MFPRNFISREIWKFAGEATVNCSVKNKKIVEGTSGEVFVKVKEVGGRVVINRNAPGSFLFGCKADNSI